jgi:sarcosine oxidase
LPRAHALPGGRDAGFRGQHVAVYNGGRRLRSAAELCTNTPTEDFVIDGVDAVTVVSPCSGHGAEFAPVLRETGAAVATAPAPAPFRVGTGAGA